MTLAVILTAGLAAAAQASSPQIRVDPASGGRRTDFTVSVRVPAPAIQEGGIDRRYAVEATGPRRKGGCVSGDAVQIANAASRARVRVTLSPRAGRWCRGTYHGRVSETIAPVCRPRCEMVMIAPQTIGTFKFRVR